MKTKRPSKIVAELKRIAKAHGGLLKPEIVVEEARDEESPLHNRFEWDDTIAGQQYRIYQARNLLRVTVHMIEGVKDPVEVFVSLTTDREKEGGYRLMTEVLTDAQMRAQMLDDAVDELECFRQKYRRLRELAEVFAAIRKVAKKKRA